MSHQKITAATESLNADVKNFFRGLHSEAQRLREDGKDDEFIRSRINALTINYFNNSAQESVEESFINKIK